jgi:hypothetical protein
MKLQLFKRSRIDDRLIIIFVFALVKLLIHLYTNAFASYEIFRDEFYYLACADRLDLGYVDQPPLSIYILYVSRMIFGDSLFAIRLLPALCGAFTVFISGLLTRKLGGGKFAVSITGLASIGAPILLGVNTIYSMNSFDILLWSLAAYLLVLIIEDNKPKHWIILGLIIGLGLLNKISMAWFACGLLIAYIVTNQRRVLLTRWPYIAGLISFGIFSPYIIWNITNDFAHLEFIRSATANKYAGVTPVDFLAGQMLLMTPISVPIWLSGLYYFLFAKDGRKFRVLGLSLLIVVFILIINGHSKPEYLSPTYPILFAAGAIIVERIVRRKYFVWLKHALPVLIVITSAFMAPFALPCLPVETYIKYSQAIGITVESHEGHELTELHQFYADMFGWESKAQTISDVYLSLPPEERARTLLVARNYGQAGAIEYYSDKYSLPPVYSPHNNYWIWGQEHFDKNYQTLIIIGGGGVGPDDFAEDGEQVSVIRCRYCMTYENNLPVYICRKLKYTIEEIRNGYKIYI